MRPSFRPKLFIDGEYTPAASGKTFPVLNPADNTPLAEMAEAGVEDPAPYRVRQRAEP